MVLCLFLLLLRRCNHSSSFFANENINSGVLQRIPLAECEWCMPNGMVHHWHRCQAKYSRKLCCNDMNRMNETRNQRYRKKKMFYLFILRLTYRHPNRIESNSITHAALMSIRHTHTQQIYLRHFWNQQHHILRLNITSIWALTHIESQSVWNTCAYFQCDAILGV